MWLDLYVDTHAYKWTRPLTHRHTDTCAHTDTRAHTHRHMHLHTHARTHTHKHMRAHKHMLALTHTYTDTYTHMRSHRTNACDHLFLLGLRSARLKQLAAGLTVLSINAVCEEYCISSGLLHWNMIY